MAKNNTYDADSISVLEGLEAVRKRPGMYIGSVSTKGLNHLIYEIVDNSVDEHLAGYCSQIEVYLEKDGSCTVIDNGRGIPVGMHAKGMSAECLVFTTLHAGGKFDDSVQPSDRDLSGLRRLVRLWRHHQHQHLCPVLRLQCRAGFTAHYFSQFRRASGRTDTGNPALRAGYRRLFRPSLDRTQLCRSAPFHTDLHGAYR